MKSGQVMSSGHGHMVYSLKFNNTKNGQEYD